MTSCAVELDDVVAIGIVVVVAIPETENQTLEDEEVTMLSECLGSEYLQRGRANIGPG